MVRKTLQVTVQSLDFGGRWMQVMVTALLDLGNLFNSVAFSLLPLLIFFS